MFPHSTSVFVLSGHSLQIMGLTTNEVSVSTGAIVDSLDEVASPHAEAKKMSEAARTKGRNVIETAYENPDTSISTCQRDTQSVQ